MASHLFDDESLEKIYSRPIFPIYAQYDPDTFEFSNVSATAQEIQQAFINDGAFCVLYATNADTSTSKLIAFVSSVSGTSNPFVTYLFDGDSLDSRYHVLMQIGDTIVPVQTEASADVNTESGFTVNTGEVFKVGNVVHINIILTAESAQSANTYVSVGSITGVVASANGITVPCSIQTTSGMAANWDKVGNAIVAEDGTIKVYCDTSWYSVSINGTYVIYN